MRRLETIASLFIIRMCPLSVWTIRTEPMITVMIFLINCMKQLIGRQLLMALLSTRLTVFTIVVTYIVT